MNPALPKPVFDYFIQTLNDRAHCFAFNTAQLGRYKHGVFQIKLADDEPVKRNQYRLSHVEKEIINKQVAELHALGLIEPAARDCKYASATVLPPKKDDAGNWTERRMCGDYRPINAKTPQDTYRMPMADEIFDELGTSNIFTTLDMLKGYNQIPIDPADRAKTAFYDGSSRLWQWTVMPFGLKNAGAEFQRCMDTTLYGLPRAKCYIDDVLVHAHHNLSSVAELKRHVDDVAATLDQTQDNGLRASPKKCRFGYFETPFLGHLLTGEGVAPLQSKVQAVQNIPQPKNVSDLRSFLPGRPRELLPPLRSQLQHDCAAYERTVEEGRAVALEHRRRGRLLHDKSATHRRQFLAPAGLQQAIHRTHRLECQRYGRCSPSWTTRVMSA